MNTRFLPDNWRRDVWRIGGETVTKQCLYFRARGYRNCKLVKLDGLWHVRTDGPESYWSEEPIAASFKSMREAMAYAEILSRMEGP